ncbi:hypothetical protein L198_07204 [Cryptococcus wingfieldii CBS 7118]|uniref:37S ribosomal protein mrp10, mitochondrial n=2 Tax=Cryptococcus TaxID=5206 RepID=A0A1E3IGH3_9TREE|nr:hypothetical protein L198_07204 [Cryptococcus wingfieldii CBS 7118]ODN86841.1 hypothetical protein L198_07204 [Cryptococcus wingfieldii CBS 7118]TYJ53059.1 hypothetical protein B9479_006339 [Cryptococcus floricola]
MPPSNFRYKVRASKGALQVPCAPELANMLQCFATTGDLRHTQSCADSAKMLHACMATGKGKGGKQGSSINHLLGKIRR